MKTIILFFYLCFFSFFAFSVDEENPPTSVYTVDDSRNFNLRCHSADDKNIMLPSVAVTLFAQYNSKENNIKVSFTKIKTVSSKDSIIELKYPLDFKYFTNTFDSLFSNSNRDQFVTHGTHLEIFYWLVTLNEKLDEMPSAGKVVLSQYVQLSNDNVNDDYSVRMESVAKEILELQNLTAQLKKKNSALYLINIEIDSVKFERDSVKLEIRKKELNSEISNIKNLINSKQQTIAKKGILEVSEVKMQFENGFLERIQVNIHFPSTNRNEIFENAYPIGFSSISNYKNFSRIRLYRRSSRYDNIEWQQYIYLSDIIAMYDNELNNLTKDYSPADTTVSVTPGSTPFVKLNKLNTIYIIDGKTFTDVNGFSENSPNGLVQLELNRRFNLLTHRYQIGGSKNYGFINYVNARVNFSKIEDKLKGLPLRNEKIIENKTVISPYYASNLDFLRYENLGINLESNLFLFDAPDYKSTIFIDFVLHYGHTPVIDSNFQLVNEKVVSGIVRPLDAHNFTVFPRARVQLFAEKRYGLTLSYQFNYTWLFSNNNFKQVLSYSGKGLDLNTLTINRTARISHSVEAAMFFDPNPQSATGKIFTKAIFHFQKGDVNTFYPQILLGYAFNIFK